MHGSLKSIIIFLDISGLFDEQKLMHGIVIEILGKFGLYSNAQFSPANVNSALPLK
jgi:hypothetical protein